MSHKREFYKPSRLKEEMIDYRRTRTYWSGHKDIKGNEAADMLSKNSLRLGTKRRVRKHQQVSKLGQGRKREGWGKALSAYT